MHAPLRMNAVLFGITAILLLAGTGMLFSAEPNPPFRVALREDAADSAFLSPSASGSRSQSLTLSIAELTSRVQRAHPAVLQAQAETDAHYGDWIQAGLKQNPELGYFGEEAGGNNKAGLQGVSFSQEMTSRRKLNARQTAATSEQAAASEQTLLTAQKAANDAALAGYAFLIAQERVAVSKEIVAYTRKAVETTQAMVDAEEAPVTDLLADQVDLARAESALAAARQEAVTASNQVAVLLGVPTSSHIVITDSIDDFPTDIDENEVWRKISESTPLLRKAHADYKAATARLQREAAEAGIDLKAEGAVLYDTSENETEVSVGFSIPVRVHNRNQGKILRAQYELQAAQANIERIELKLRQDFQTQIGEFHTAREKVLLYRSSLLAKVQKSYKMISESYSRGECSVIELLDAARTVQSVRMSYLDDLMTMISSRTLLNGYLLQGAGD